MKEKIKGERREAKVREEDSGRGGRGRERNPEIKRATDGVTKAGPRGRTGGGRQRDGGREGRTEKSRSLKKQKVAAFTSPVKPSQDASLIPG